MNEATRILAARKAELDRENKIMSDASLSIAGFTNGMLPTEAQAAVGALAAAFFMLLGQPLAQAEMGGNIIAQRYLEIETRVNDTAARSTQISTAQTDLETAKDPPPIVETP